MAGFDRLSALAALGAAGVLLAGCGTYTGANNPQAARDPAATVCRDVLEPPSNTPRNVCMTNAEWDDYDRSRRNASQDFMRDLNNRPIPPGQ